MAFRIDGFSRVRAALDLSGKTGPLTDALNDGPLRFARGARTRFEFLLKHGETIADPSLISVARLRVLSTSDPDSVVALDKTISVTSINAGVTQDQWDAGEPDMAHLRFEFTSSETAEGVFTATLADSDADSWFLLTYGSGDDFLYAGLVKHFDAGYTSAGTPPASGTAATIEQVRSTVEAMLANVVRFEGNPAGAKIALTSAVGGLKVRLGCDDAGNFSTGTQPTD